MTGRPQSPQEVAQRLEDTFSPSSDLPKRFLSWARDHDAAIKAARALLESPLTVAIAAACDDAQRERVTELTVGEWCDLLEHQVNELRELEGSADIPDADVQARARLVKLAGLSIAFADTLDLHIAKVNDVLVGAAE